MFAWALAESIIYIWIFRSPMKSTFQWIKQKGNLRLRWMSTLWKGNFIKFSIELYFGICYVLYAGVNPWRSGRNKAMTTRKRRWTWCQQNRRWGMVPQNIHDEIQKLRTKTNSLEHGWMKKQEAQLNTWWCWERTTTDFIRQHQTAWILWILAQRTMASRQ
jgi:hypothetical protein